MSNTDPDNPCDDEAQKFVILTAVKKSDGRPYPLRLNAAGELVVDAEFTGDVQVDIDLPDVLSGKTFTLTGAIDQLPVFECKAGAMLTNDDGNAAVIWLGGNDVAINNGYKLPIGEDIPIVTQNLSHIYAIGTLGDKIHYFVG